ncbi:6-bladed beta-propeller [uncultured Bacteroides sp.]|uniref:6-bladed beta-propeller n=1 Tax=uncultured Bacteroides sp. TaxID=162156 RepID=UPI0025FE5299|nr:6-bladed beta-propeller [uncultured Bacteroides sp.]
MKQYIYGSFLCLLLYSCIKSERYPYLLITPENLISKSLELSELIDTVIYIPIDTTVLIRGLGRRFLINDDCMFFDTNEGVLKFDKQGKFLMKIGCVGGAPQEYSNYRAIAMDKENERIYVYSLPKKLAVYNFDGVFLNSSLVELPDDGLYPVQIYHRNGLLYFFYTNCLGGESRKPLHWVITNMKGELVTCWRGSDTQLGADYAASFGTFGVSVKDENSFIYWDLFNDTIFHVKGMEHETAYLWAEGEFRLLDTDNFNIPNENRRICTAFIDTDNFLLLRWYTMQHIGMQMFFSYCDKKEHRCYKLDDLLIFPNTRLSLLNRYFTYECIDGYGYLLMSVKVGDLQDIASVSLEQSFLNDEENIVLIMMRLKQ